MDENLGLYFGCAHTQFHAKRHLQFENGYPYDAESWEAFIEQAYGFASGYIDFFPAIYYPAYTYHPTGDFMIESEGMKEEFAEEWKRFKEISRRHNQPGELVTFAGYEWTGDRRRWGDHNVIYFDEDDAVLDLSMDVHDLFSRLEEHRCFAIPHHTGYRVGYRGKDWDIHDPELSPVAEVFSVHGSSEAVDSPYDMRYNPSMSPRVSGGTIQDGLDRGLRFGLIASGDNGGGFPGRWGHGLAAVWARELTREAVWEAIARRRTYAVTGDRIKLDFEANQRPMGSELTLGGGVELSAAIEASDSIDRVELIRDGRVIDTDCRRGRWEKPRGSDIEVKLRVELGWGPPPNKGIDVPEKRWHGVLSIGNGSIADVERCFTRGGQTVTCDSKRAEWHLSTGRNVGPTPNRESQQAMVFTIRGSVDTGVRLETEGTVYNATVAELSQRSTVIPHPEEPRKLVAERYGLTEYENQLQKEYANSYKTLIHRAVPSDAFRLIYSFEDDPDGGDHYYYLRVSQDNGQMAWSSPIWIRRPAE